jgi:hypothetical protein
MVIAVAKPRLVMGDEIAGYRLGEILGVGGLGTVYATSRDGRDLAIKIIAHGGDQGLQVRATREVEALRRLDHPNVLGLVDAGADDTWSYLVMRRIAGASLRELVAGGPLTPESAALLVMHAARGVGAIHAAGLCHRDLKPDNIMITDDGRVVIIDLGLALAPDWTRQTTEGAIAGSLPYMAPEQIEGNAGAASDVWALAVTWWELVTGTRPFARSRPVEEIAAIVAGARPAIIDVDRRIDDAYAAVIERCLTRDVAARPAHGDALAAAIGQLGLAIEDRALRALRHDRAGWESGVAEQVASQCARVADELASAGDVFAAMRAIDRGLAYRPGEPTLESMLARIMPPNTAGAVGTPRRPRPITAEAIAPTQLAIPTKRRRWPWFAGGGVVLAAAAIIAMIATRNAPAPAGPDLGDPRVVMQAVIDAAKTGDHGLLTQLCNTDSEPSAQRLCDARPGTTTFTRLRELFRDGSVEGAYRTADGATVMLRLGSKRASVELVRRHGRYYIRTL